MAVYAGVLATTVALAGCGGGDSEPDSTDAGGSEAKTTSADTTNAKQPENECVGDGKGSITAPVNEAVELPGGGKATMAVADLEESPPTVSFELDPSTVIEQKNATALNVGDQFGVARGVYVVVRICPDEAVIDEF